MKANEAPERLYLSKNIYSTFLYQVPDPDDETAVEYTRSDAVIDKACDWIKENLLKHTYVYEGEVGIGMAVFFEEFKQAMKGE